MDNDAKKLTNLDPDYLQNLSKEALVRLVLNIANKSDGKPHSTSSTPNDCLEVVSSSEGDTESLLGDYVKPAKILFDGHSLTPEELVAIGSDPTIPCDLSESAWQRVARSRDIVDNILARKEVVYGINTGFGNFANVVISDAALSDLQSNLVRSHAAGVGRPLPIHQARMLLALRINILAKGHSGIRPSTIRTMLQALALNLIPYIPSQGTVGASGDLAPLSHLALGLMGEGKMWDPSLKQFAPAEEVMKRAGVEPVKLAAKEGLALINGTQMIVAVGAEAVVRAKRIARQADVVAAMTLEALKGSTTSFHPYIHQARPHRGQGLVAGRMRDLLAWGNGKSEIAESHKNCCKVQDSYTLRCIPQIHGVVNETIHFVYKVLLTEMNSATDNPMVFPNAHKTDINDLPAEKEVEVEMNVERSREAQRMLLRGVKPKEYIDDMARSTSSSSLQGTRSSGPSPSNLSSTSQMDGLYSRSVSPQVVSPNKETLIDPFDGKTSARSIDEPGPLVSSASSPHIPASLPNGSPFSIPTSTHMPLPPSKEVDEEKSQTGLSTQGPEQSKDSIVIAASTSQPVHYHHHHETDGTVVVCGADPSSISPCCAVGGAIVTRPRGNTEHKMQEGVILSGGNFHGEYPAKVLDYLAIAVHELSSVSERRIERLVNPALSGLPAFLTPKGGLNSGFMIAHCTAAALVSENKTLCHPASVDSLSTSAAQEDHVSMGGFAARKALDVVRHVEQVLAIELLCACQAIEFLRPLKTTPALESVHHVVRTVVKPWTHDRYMAPDIEAAHKLLEEEKVWAVVSSSVRRKFHTFIPAL